MKKLLTIALLLKWHNEFGHLIRGDTITLTN